MLENISSNMQCGIEAGYYCKGWYEDDMWKPASKYSTSTAPLTIPALRAHWHLEEEAGKQQKQDGELWNGPVMISTNSFVMLAWRPRLYCMVRRPIMSDAFFDALSIALRLRRCQYTTPQHAGRICSPSTLFAGVPLDKSRVDSIGKRELSKILRHVVLHLIRPEAG